MSLRSSRYLCPASLLALLSIGCPGPEPSLDADGTGGADPAGTSTGIGPGGPGSGSVVASSSAQAGTSSSATSSSSGAGGDKGEGGRGGAGPGAGGHGGAGGANDGGGGAGGRAECATIEDCNCDEDECHVEDAICFEGECVFKCDSGYLDIIKGDDVQGLGCETRGARVFVTSVPTDLPFDEPGGAAGAHEFCGDLASDSEWYAWISDETFSPFDDFEPLVVPYVLVDNTIVAENWTDLVTGPLGAAIGRDQDGGEVRGVEVWTGTNPSGEALLDDTCGNWTNEGNTPRAAVGNSAETGPEWTVDGEPKLCLEKKVSVPRHLYCFEHLP